MSDEQIPGAGRSAKRLVAAWVLVWVILAFVLPLSALTLNVVKVAGFPLGFWVAAQGSLFGLVALAWIFVFRAGGDHDRESFSNALSYSGEVIASAGFMGFVGFIAALGFDGLAYPLGMTAGLALLVILIAPRFVSYPVPSVAGFFDLRFGGQWPRRLAIAIAALASVLLLAADLRGSSLALRALFGLDADSSLAAAAALTGTICMTAMVFARGRPSAAVYPFFVLAFLCALGAMALALGRVPLPHLTYGFALEETAALERGLIAAKLADPRSMKPLTAPFLQVSQLNFVGLVLGLALGLAALPQLIGRHLSHATVAPGAAVRRAAKALTLVTLFLSGLAAYAALSREAIGKIILSGVKTAELPESFTRLSGMGWVEVCGTHSANATDLAAACAKVSGHKGLLRLQDVAFANDAYLFASAELAAIPGVFRLILAMGALAAALAAGYAILTGLQTAISDRSEPAPRHREVIGLRAVLAPAALLLSAVCVAAAALAEIPALASEGLALIASGLFPAFIFGLYWRRFDAKGAVAAMATGVAVAGIYILSVRAFPLEFFDLTGTLSDAAPSSIRKLETLRASVIAAQDAALRQSLEAELHRQAAAVANWWGLKPGASALLGVPAGVLAGVFVTLLSRRKPREA